MTAQGSENQARAGALTRAARFVDGWLGDRRGLSLAVACAVCLVANLGYAHYRVIAADETLQMFLVRQPNLRAIWNAMCAGVQVDPPVLDAVDHYLFRAFGDRLLLARLPSVFGFCLMCLCLSLIVWRYAGPTYGTAAFFMPFATSLRSWASLTRPEALRLGFSAAALLCWDRLQDEHLSHRWRWRLALIASLWMTFSTHFYSITILFPLALGELAKWRIRKRIDWAAVACIAVGFIPWVVWSPILVAATHVFLPHPFRPEVFKPLSDFYGEMLYTLPWVGALVLMLFAGACLRSREDDSGGPPELARHGHSIETMMVFCAGCLLLPVCGALITAVKSGLYVPRMSTIAAFGLVIGPPLLLTLVGARRIVALALLAPMAANAAMVAARGAVRLRGVEAPYPSFAELRRLISEPHPDIVLANNYHGGAIIEANKDDPEQDLLYLYDANKQMEARNNDTPDVAARIMQSQGVPRVLPFDPYVATHSHFYLLSTQDIVAEENWQFRYLLAKMHAGFTWLGNVKGWDLYRIDVR